MSHVSKAGGALLVLLLIAIFAWSLVQLRGGQESRLGEIGLIGSLLLGLIFGLCVLTLRMKRKPPTL